MTTRLFGVRTRHLRIEEVAFPHRAFTVVVGPSGAGKSTLLLDTLHAESRRRLDEVLAVERHRLVSGVARPPVDRATGLLPTLAHARETPGIAGHRPVSALAAIDDALALLAVREGTLACPSCDEPMEARSAATLADDLLAREAGSRLTILAPLGLVSSERRESLLAEGWVRVRVRGKLVTLDELAAPFEGELVVDRIALRDGVRGRIVDGLELAWRLGAGEALLAVEGREEERVSSAPRCRRCGFAIAPTAPEDLAWSSPKSRCLTCEGAGVVATLDVARAVDDERSLTGGAIRAWGAPSQPATKALLAQLAKAHGLPLDAPLASLDRHAVDAALGLAPSSAAPTVLGELLARESEDDERPRASTFLRDHPCPRCDGTGRSDAFRAHRLDARRLTDLHRLTLRELGDALASAPPKAASDGRYASVRRELARRVHTACTIGLGHLASDRKGATLSRGELQRARLVAQLGAPLEAVMHVLDEPTDGLHPLDARAVIEAVRALVDEGATVVSIAHDPLTIASADHALVLGPGAGRHGGQLLAAGAPSEVAPPNAPRPRTHDRLASERWALRGCTMHHLEGRTITIPRGALVVFTGVSGSGKSTLLRDGLAVAAEARRFDFEAPQGHGVLEGPSPSCVVYVDDRPLARGTRSTVASAVGVFDALREAYAATAEARARGYGAGRFSPNLRGGRCERCEGSGLEPGARDRYDDTACIACNGDRFNRETNEVLLHGHGIGALLAKPLAEAADLLRGNTKIAPRLDTLVTLGLGYLPLGQTTGTLSGGEARRVLLARALARTDLEGALVLLDEPTAGLSNEDVECFLDATEQLRARGATVVITEHRPAVIAASDWVVELGPGAGANGGRVIVEGPLEAVLACEASVTRRALALAAR